MHQCITQHVWGGVGALCGALQKTSTRNSQTGTRNPKTETRTMSFAGLTAELVFFLREK